MSGYKLSFRWAAILVWTHWTKFGRSDTFEEQPKFYSQYMPLRVKAPFLNIGRYKGNETYFPKSFFFLFCYWCNKPSPASQVAQGVSGSVVCWTWVSKFWPRVFSRAGKTPASTLGSLVAWHDEHKHPLSMLDCDAVRPMWCLDYSFNRLLWNRWERAEIRIGWACMMK